MKDVIYHIYGREIANNLIPLEFEKDGVRLSGYLGKPVINRGNRNFENYFVNGRYVRNSILAKAIEDGYKDFTMQHRYPFVAFQIEINPEKIDVNVHPSKMELRFSNQQGIYNLLYEAISKGLHEPELIPEVEMSEIKEMRGIHIGQMALHPRCERVPFRRGQSERNPGRSQRCRQQNFRHR